MRRALLLLALLLGVAPSPARAGDPSLVWRTIETPNFRIHFYRGEDAMAYRLARIAEKVHDTLVPHLRWRPASPTHVVLTDQTDGANGFADITPYNLVRLFLASPGESSTLGDYDDWLYTLFMHEYTHILHIDNVGGLPALSHYLVGKRWAPNQIQPRWFTEGLATFHESRRTSGGRLRSSLFQMQLRAAVLEDRLETLDGMSSGTWRYPHGNIPYLYGSFFVDFIARRAGEDSFGEISRIYGRLPLPFALNRVARQVLGATYRELYEEWVDELRRRFDLQREEVQRRGPTESVALTATGEWNGSPFFQRGRSDRVLYGTGDGHRHPSIRSVPLTGGDSELVYEFPGGGGPFWLTPDGARVVYSEGETCVPTASSYDELFVWDRRTAERRQLTRCLRARSPSVSPDGKRVAFASTETGTAASHLGVLALDGPPGPPVEPGDPRVRWIVRSAPGDQVMAPAFSPDGQTIAYSGWTAGGYRDLFLVPAGGGAPRRLWRDRALDIDPRWSADGRYLFFASDRSGIYNIYAWEAATERVLQVTEVVDGAFEPQPSPDGRWLAFQRYSSRGFDLHALPLEPARWREAAPYTDEHPSVSPDLGLEAVRVPMRERDYRFHETFRPRAWSFNSVPGSFGQNITLTTDASDAAGLHAIGATLEVGTSRGEVNEFVSYSYFRFVPSLHADFRHFTIRRGGVVIDGQATPYAEETWEGGAVVRYPLVARNDRSSSVAIDYRYSNFEPQDLEIPLDPNARIPVRPETGSLAGVGFSWSYDDAREYTFTEGAVRGRRVGLSLRLQYPELGGDFRTNRVTWRWYEHFGLPFGEPTSWWKRHAIAVGYEGGISDGNLRRRGVFVLGGFSGDTGDPIRGLFDPEQRVGDATLRGYTPGAVAGDQYHLFRAEYRLPIAVIERGLTRETSPFYLGRLSAKLFTDWGHAFSGDADLEQFRHGVGGELGLTMRLWYNTDVALTLGVAHGFDLGGDTQLYFALKSAL